MERRGHLAFLTTCSTTLRAGPPKTCGIMVPPSHLLLGNAPISTLLYIPPGISPPEQEPALQTPPSSALAATRPSPQSKWQQNLPDQVEAPSPLVATSNMTPKEPPHSRQKEEMPLHKALTRSQQEAFNRDSQLVHKVREEYYQENHPHFNSKNSCNLMDIFWNMVESASLLGSEIYEIQETWTGRCELEYTNYTLKILPKGLKFFCPVSPLESPKVKGLASIYHPDVLHHFNVCGVGRKGRMREW